MSTSLAAHLALLLASRRTLALSSLRMFGRAGFCPTNTSASAPGAREWASSWVAPWCSCPNLRCLWKMEVLLEFLNFCTNYAYLLRTVLEDVPLSNSLTSSASWRMRWYPVDLLAGFLFPSSKSLFVRYHSMNPSSLGTSAPSGNFYTIFNVSTATCKLAKSFSVSSLAPSMPPKLQHEKMKAEMVSRVS